MATTTHPVQAKAAAVAAAKGAAKRSKASTSSKATKPASEPATGAVGVKELAAHLGTDPRSMRKFLRTLDLGVGFGNRYSWASLADTAVKPIIKAWREAEAAEAE